MNNKGERNLYFYPLIQDLLVDSMFTMESSKVILVVASIFGDVLLVLVIAIGIVKILAMFG